jgi:two-component system, sensor histidine kinase PdtaS
MASLADLARVHTRLDAGEINQLQRLVATWGLLADLCFADLLLFAEVDADPGAGREAGQPLADSASLVVLGQMRPLTNQTLYRSDWVGNLVPARERPLVARSVALGEIIDGEVTSQALKERVRALCIPVRWKGRTIAVVNRESAPSVRHPGELERTYVEVFNRFARMIAAGEFPFASEEGLSEEAPRVGDGVILLDGSARVEYASPNAVSALHRIGVHANTEGMRLGELGLEEGVVRTAFSLAVPDTEEIERGPQVTVLMRCIPLLEHGKVTGAVVLLRDISELRRRDRLLVSKDATIREIHHRVKNNLQTISSLLRLQGRRSSSPEAKAAIEESVRRIRSIALVHEILSHEAGDDVPFVEIARPLVRMVEEGLLSPDRPIEIKITGDAGNLPATVATPLSVVLNELLQNVVDHAYPGEEALGGPGRPERPEGAPGHVLLEFDNDGRELRACISDDGVGLRADFSVDASTGLGLSIVRTLVTTELGGTIDFGPGEGDADWPGTSVELRVPLGADTAGPEPGGGDPPDAQRPSDAEGR